MLTPDRALSIHAGTLLGEIGRAPESASPIASNSQDVHAEPMAQAGSIPGANSSHGTNDSDSALRQTNPEFHDAEVEVNEVNVGVVGVRDDSKFLTRECKTGFNTRNHLTELL